MIDRKSYSSQNKVKINLSNLVVGMSGAQIAREIHDEFLRRLTEAGEIPLDMMQQLKALLESGEQVTELKVIDLIKGTTTIDKN